MKILILAALVGIFTLATPPAPGRGHVPPAGQPHAGPAAPHRVEVHTDRASGPTLNFLSFLAAHPSLPGDACYTEVAIVRTSSPQFSNGFCYEIRMNDGTITRLPVELNGRLTTGAPVTYLDSSTMQLLGQRTIIRRRESNHCIPDTPENRRRQETLVNNPYSLVAALAQVISQDTILPSLRNNAVLQRLVANPELIISVNFIKRGNEVFAQVESAAVPGRRFEIREEQLREAIRISRIPLSAEFFYQNAPAFWISRPNLNAVYLGDRRYVQQLRSEFANRHRYSDPSERSNLSTRNGEFDVTNTVTMTIDSTTGLPNGTGVVPVPVQVTMRSDGLLPPTREIWSVDTNSAVYRGLSDAARANLDLFMRTMNRGR